MANVSEAIFSLRPVSFRYKKEPTDKAFSNTAWSLRKWKRLIPIWSLGMRKAKLYTVRYEAVNAMVLNEFLKEHRKLRPWKSSQRSSKKKSRCSPRV